MKQLGRRTIGLFLAVVMLLSLVPVAFADNTANFPDFPTGWSKEAMTAAVSNGLLTGYDDGNIHPEVKLTRAQFAAIITRAFGAKTKADVSAYSDVLADAWYYDAIAKAVKMGVLNGKSSTQMDPDASITRQEVFTAIARVLVLSDDDTSALDKFNDKGEIASWAINYMAALTKRGYVNGDPEGNVNPKAFISREEFAQVMHNAIRTYITEPGTYKNDLDGITVVRVGDVTLKGLKNTSDLVIGDGAGEGNINIESVTIEKRLLARGGTIKVSKSTRGDFVVVNNMNGVTNFKNYRDEAFFKDIVENTQAKFLERAHGGTGGGGGGGTGGSDTVYTLTLKVDGAPYDTVTVTNGVPNKSVTDPTKDYYTFDGWYDAGNNKITNFATVTATQDLNAKFTANTYNVTFTGTPSFSWKDGYSPITSFTVEEFGTKQLPPADKVDALGYTFEYWKINGNRVNSLQAIKDGGYLPTTPANLTIEAHFTLKTYRIEYQDATFVSGYVAPTEYNINNASTTQLPPKDKVVAPAGQELKYWKVQSTGTRIDSLTVTVMTPDTLVLVPHFGPIGGDVVYTLTLKVDGTTYNTVTVTNGIPDKTVADPTKDYYTFDGWYNGAVKVENFAAVTQSMTLDAKFNAIPYAVTFTGTPLFTWKDLYSPIANFTVDELSTKELPPADKVAAPTGYIFEYWKIGTTRVDSLAEIKDGGYLPTNSTASLTIEAHYSLKEYTVAYTGVTWKEGCEPTNLTYNILNAASYVLPTKDDVVAPAGEEFKYWKDATTGVRVDILTIDENTSDVVTLTPHFELIPVEPVTVTFYRIYSTLPPFKIGTPLSIEKGTTVDKSSFPNAESYARKTGYKEDASVASLYAGNEYEHTIVPEFWYVKDGVMTSFDDTVEVNENTNVYLLSKSLSLMMNYEYNGTVQALSVSADYNKDTRVMNTIKDIVARSGRQQLALALDQDMIPNYDEMVAKAVDAMVKSGIIELDGDKKNVQIVDVPFKISTFVKEDTANNMIKQYLRDVVKNPAELDKIFSMIDVAEFAEQLGIDTIIEQMTDAEIVSLIKSNDNKGDIVDYVFTDLKKEDSAMLDFVIDYLLNDAEFRADLIDQIVADLKDKGKTSTLKTKALDYIMTQIADDKSLFYGKFVDMVATDLKSTNSVVMDEVVKYIRTNLKATTQEGKDLRKEILTSSLLPEFLSDPKMKAEVIKIALTDAFIEKALNNTGYREILVEAVMADEAFVELLLNSTEFHDYIVDQLHPADDGEPAHPLAKDVEDLIKNETSEFRKHVLNLVKNSDAFKTLFATHPELKQVVSDEIKWIDFVSDDEDLLRYVLQQGNVTGTYTFISIGEIEQAIADEYNARAEAAVTGNYETLSESDKQLIRNEIYADVARKQTVLDAIKDEFDSYKSDMVDKITTGKAGQITDQTVINLVDELLADYVTKYIEKQTLNADPTINASITKVIEDILFGFIKDLILGVDLNNPALDTELDAMLSHIDAVKHQFVVDPTESVVKRLIAIVKQYKNNHATNINKVVNDNYTKLTDKILGMLNPDDPNSVYSDVESTLITVADDIDVGVIKNYITKIADTDLKDLIKKYMKNVTVADLNNYIASFLTVAENENAVRTELNAFVQDPNQKETVKGFAKTYINDPLNETEIKDNISKFIEDIDEEFVNENRAVITDALKSIDISEFVDEEYIKDYVEGLDESKGEKTKFADDIFAALRKDADYSKFMHQLLNGDAIEVNKSNVSLVTAISGAIRGLTFDDVIDFVDNSIINKLKDTAGVDFIKKYYDSMMADYCDGLDAVIDEVKASSDGSIKKTYKTSLTLRVNIFEIYEELYDKAADKAFEKLDNAGIYYNENKYLNFLIEQDFLSYLFDGDKSLASGDFTGYSLKGVMDYYDYLTMLLIVGDDALTWYGDDEGEGLTQAQLEALYDAMFEKIFTAHEKMNDILVAFKDDDKLPSKVQNAIESVEKLNSLVLQYGDKAKSLIKKYLDSSINAKFEDESIADSERVIKMLDVLIGNDDPVLTIDTIYAVIYEYDDDVQEKLKQVIESDKFKQAVDKFEATSFGEMFDGKGKLGTVGDKLDELKNNGKIESALDSLYDLFYILAYEGIDAFKVPADEMEVTDIDIYKVKIAKVEMTVKRAYR